MYSTVDGFKEYIRGRRVTVIGIGISNTPLIRFLTENGAEVTACDKKTEPELGSVAQELMASGVKLRLGDNYLDDISGDIVFKTPGLRYDNPQLVKARSRGAVVTSEMEVFFEICPSQIIAVTGSDGKTTTTTLIYEMLTKSGLTCHLGGNIGKPVLYRVEEMKKTDIAVLELSSFQLHTMRKSPHIAVITNLSPNHLDMHKGYEEYIEAKENIMLYQKKGDTVVLNKENEVTAALAARAAGKAVMFSSQREADVDIKDGYIRLYGEKILKISDIRIPGKHNAENYMAAIAATAGLAKKSAICEVARGFGGVPHRIELVRELDGVKYYNSSIDSSPNRTINTLKVFKRPVILIAGGKDKGIPYDALGPAIADGVKRLILVGATAGAIRASLEAELIKRGGGDIPVTVLDSYGEAVTLARAEAADGDVVLMSNASTSFDMFKNFEERGNLFKKLVNSL